MTPPSDRVIVGQCHSVTHNVRFRRKVRVLTTEANGFM
jgi:hypothetical protein